MTITRLIVLMVSLTVIANTSHAKCTGILFTIEGDLTAAEGARKIDVEVLIPPDSWVVEKARYEGTRFRITVGFYPGTSHGWFGENCSGKPQAVYVRLLEAGTILDSVTLLPSQDFSPAGENRFVTKRRVLLRNR